MLALHLGEASRAGTEAPPLPRIFPWLLAAAADAHSGVRTAALAALRTVAEEQQVEQRTPATAKVWSQLCGQQAP